jgi:cell division control protein 24
VPSNIEFDDLSRKIEDKLKLCVQETSISISGLKYEDEDGDLITINSDEDVQMGFEVKGPNNVVNFHVTTVC